MAGAGGAGRFGGEMRITQPRHELVATAREISIDGERFLFSEIDRVAYGAQPMADGGYGQRLTEFFLRLGRESTSSRFSIAENGRFEFPSLGECPDNWRAILDLVEVNVCGRIAASMAGWFATGGEIMIGEVIADASGLRQSSRFSATSVAWNEIAEATFDRNTLQVLRLSERGMLEAVLELDLDEWNVVVLPRVMRLILGLDNVVITDAELQRAEQLMRQFEQAVGTNDPLWEAMHAIGRLGGALTVEQFVAKAADRDRQGLPAADPDDGYRPWRWWAKASQAAAARGHPHLPILVFSFLEMFISTMSPKFRPEDWIQVGMNPPSGTIVVEIAGYAIDALAAINDTAVVVGNATGTMPAGAVRRGAAFKIRQQWAEGTPVPDLLLAKARHILGDATHGG